MRFTRCASIRSCAAGDDQHLAGQRLTDRSRLVSAKASLRRSAIHGSALSGSIHGQGSEPLTARITAYFVVRWPPASGQQPRLGLLSVRVEHGTHQERLRGRNLLPTPLAMPHHCRALRILDLDPIPRQARPVRRAQPLRHDALESHFAGVHEDKGAILAGVLAEDNPEPPLADQLGQMFLAVDQWQTPQQFPARPKGGEMVSRRLEAMSTDRRV